MYKSKLFKRTLSLLICLAMVLAYLPVGTLRAAAADRTLNIVSGSKKADPSTIDWENYFGPDKLDTEFAGGVWTDKSVFTGTTPELPGVTMTDSNNFLVALSSIASNLSITGHTSAPTDTMLVLDLSGSMVDGTYEVGTIRQNNYNYQTVNGIDMSLINAMIEATNATIDKLMKQNTNNRIGVVLYSGNATIYEDATPGTATVVLPLNRYAGINGEYLSVDTTWRTDALYSYNYSWFGGGWQATGESATYVPEGTAVNVSVKNGLKTESGANVADVSKYANGGTYLQNGMYQAMNQFLNVTDTTVPEGRPQAGAERMPVLVLMTDGAPTIATTSYTNIGNSNTGDGTTTDDRITFLTQLTAAYVRGRVASHYQENQNDEKDILFLTLGLGTENSSAATNTLYPAGSNSDLVTYWNRYLAANAGQNVTAITGSNSLTVRREADVEAMNYVDTYYYASDAQGLIDSFTEIVSEIELKSESYATLVEGGNADLSGYVTFEDELGELMHVADMKGVLMSDGNGGTVLYTGKGIAESMSAGNLGTVDNPNERGDELVRTVRERIPGTSTTQAQQLIGNAYADQQLYYADDNNWSNYIGWYADADGNYVGFWDKDSGYENAPAGAVYANKSYGYLGVNGDSDMMHVVVMVRTELATLHQSVYFKIPASLLPTVQYKVTLNEDDPTVVEDFLREDATPMQLVFEVGLRSDINSVNLEQKIAEHIAKGGHVHRNADGTVTFYTNEWSIGNDTNGNGIPDPDEVETAMVAESHFQPAMDNSRYFYTENTPVLDARGNVVTGATRPSGTYYHHRHIYNETERITMTLPIAESTLRDKAQYDRDSNRWYIPAGTIFSEVSRFKVDKTENTTNTLSYSDFPAVFENGSKQDAYAFLGNNGSITVAPATGITLRKQVQGNIEGVDLYTFQVTLSDIPSGTTAAPVLTDANGDALSGVTMSGYTNGQFTVTMPANVTAYISGIPVGTTVQIAEQIDGDYKIVDIQVAGQKQSVNAPATTTVPAYSEGVSQMVPVVITNAPNSYGNLVISKDIIHNLASDPEAMADKEFTFRVKLSGSKITAGTTFRTSENATVTVDSDGYLTYADGEPIKLQNEESVTVYRIPEGTTYTVTEDSLPGFTLDNINGDTDATEASGVISASEESLEAFFNRYPDVFVPVEVPVEVDVTKVLNQISPYSGDEEFVFVLQMLLPDGTYPSIAATNGSEYLKVGAGETEQAAFKLTFDELGTYFFRVVELKPSEQTPKGEDTPGMTYSTMRALFQVIVTDNDMDGTLEVAVREEANVTVTPHYDNDDTEQIEKISVAATFTNNYQVNSTNTTLNVHKDLNNNTGAQKPLTDFHFTMYPCDAEGNVADGTAGTQVTTSALGDATFNIFLDTAGTYYYVVSENIPGNAKLDAETGKYVLNGMSYDPARYLYTVVAEVGSDSDLVVTSRTLVNLTTGANVDPANGAYTAVFVNDYELTPTDVHIPFSKQLTGRAPMDQDQYQTYLVRTDGSFNTLTGSNAWNGSYFIDANRSSTVKLTFDKVGTYHYKWTEVAPDDAELDPATGKYVLNGVSYDPVQFHITVTVSDNGTGGLTAQTVIHKLGETAPVTSADFVNTYTVVGSEDVTIGGRKVLDGRAMVAGEFTIGLYSDADCKNLIETTTNRANGTFAFSTITYTVADLGENNAEKTYTYYVKEINDGKGGVTYDPNVYTVTVKVGHEDGTLTVTPSGNAVTLQINNTYEAKPVDVVLNGSKVLSGDWSSVENKEFTFQLFRANSRFAITDTDPLQQRSVTGEDTFSMTLSYEDGEEGSYYYVLKEDASAQAGGVGYDAGEYHITVNVSDPGDGQLVATTTIYRPGTGNTSTAVFTNTYTVESTSITLEGTKTYTNSITGESMVMEEGMFSFLVLEGEDLEHAALAATGYNLADGTIRFTPIRYTAAGVHTYSVVELPGDLGGVSYDTQTIFTVTVTVVDNGNGTLTATADYNETPLEFENTYTHQSAQITFNGKKSLTGDWSAVPSASKIFNFELYKTNDSFTVSGDPVDSVASAAGDFTFGTQTYTTEGTHYYVILERSGETGNGITYDGTEYHITVVVEDDGVGNLIPTVTASESNVTVTADAENSGLVTVDGLDFTNDYQTSPAEYTPEAQKLYVGDEMKEFDFVLTVDGNDKQTKQNDADGKVVFDTLTFDTAGEYELKIREQENILWGLIRWDRNVYTITLHVEDDGAGQLFVNESKTVITSEKGRDDLVFRNVHHDVITKKDVFTVSEPTVSIDGKTVEKNDILLYKVSYTNYDSVPVDVTITDVIPQYTTYVAGSADNGGTLTGNTLSWTLEDVAPDATVTVSFRVKVIEANITVINDATVLEGENEYHTNEVTNPVKEDKVIKDVFLPAEPTVSIDGDKVEKNEILLYKVTYTNSDDFAADVTITDVIPQYTTYVDGSADNGGTYADGVLTWNIRLAAGASKTVSFQVKVIDTNITVINQAVALEGENRLETNIVTNPVVDDQVIKDVFHVSEPTISIDGKAVEKNDILLYKVTYTNSDDFAADVTITDAIPEYTTYVAGSADNGGTYADGVLTWNLRLAAGESKTVSFQVKVIDTNITVINQAVALEGENELVTNQVRNPVEEDLVIKDVFTVSEPTVSIDGKTVEKGDVLLYTITYTNFDGLTADVTITDTIPEYTTYVAGSADNGGTYADGVITWNIQLAAGESKTVSFQVKVIDTNITVINQATALEGENVLETNQVTNPVEEDKVIKDVFLPAEPTISIDGDKVEKGEILLYKVTYTNSDDFPADVTITDAIPEYTTYVTGSADNGGTFAEGVLTWNIQLAAGESKTVSFQVKVIDTNITVINQATALEGENKLETNIVTNPVVDDQVIKDVFTVSEPTVSIDGKTVEKGDILLYKVTYTNSDDFPADVTITDTIPEYTTYVTGSADNGGTYAEGVLTWNIRLAAGESITVSFQVKVIDTNITVINQAVALEGENELETNQVTNPVEEDKVIKDVFLPAEPTISIDGDKVEKNEILLYKVTYTNSDDFPADVTITDAIPQYTTYVDGSADNGGTFTDGVLTWSLKLAAGESKTVSFRVKVIETNITVINQATALEGENRLETNQVTNPVVDDTVIKDVFHVSEPTVSIDGQAVEKNDILLYKVTYTNSDDFAADVTITDAIPEYTTYVAGSADNGGSFADGVLTWNLQLAAGESKTVSFQVKVIDTKITVINQAVALEGENELVTNQVRNPVDEDLVIKDVFTVSEPTVSIDGKTVEKGDVLLYTITYTNFDGLAADVTITDAIPEYTTYVTGSADNGGTYAEGVLTWNVHLAAGESITVSFQVKVIDTNITVINQATALEGENKLETNVVTNPVEEDEVIKDVFLPAEPTISIDGKTVEKNDILLYKVTYTNSDDFAANVTITDAIPEYTTYVAGSADNDGTYAEGVLTWNIQLAAGESKTVSFQVKVIDTNITVINQAVALEGENKLETNVVTNPVEEDEVVKDVFLPAEPTISIDGKAVEKGDILLYKVTYTNSDDFAADVTITDAIPAYTTYVDGSADNGGTFTDGVITWNVQLAAGESITVSFQVKVIDTKITVINQAAALEGENELVTNQVRNPVDEDLVIKDVFAVNEPTVSIDGKNVQKGDVLLYTITYTNSDGLAADVTITDAIPEYTTYVDGSADNGGTFADGVLTWNLKLAAGASKTVSFRVKVIGTNVTVINQATALEGENKLETNIVTNPVPEDKVEKDVFHVNKPTVSIDGKTVEKGDILLYKVTYTNSHEAAADVTITDAIPEYTTYVDGSADNGGTYAKGVLTWNVHLDAGESITVSFQVKVTKGNITVVNQATALEGRNELKTNIVTNKTFEPEESIPKTDDRINIPALMGIMSLSTVVMLAVLVLGRKKNIFEQ